jgi:uncharacterized protein
MARLLFWILLAVIAYAVAKHWSRAGVGRRNPAGKLPSEPIVSCAACGLHLPQSEAHASGGQWYCSREHLEQARGAP